MWYAVSSKVVQRVLLPLLLANILTACGGGGGGGNVTLTTNNQGADPVLLEVPVAYVKRPLSDDVPDVRDPLAFFPGAELFVRERSATTADDIDVTELIRAIVAEEEGVEPAEIALDIKDVESSFDGNTLVFAARAVPEPVDDNLEETTWNLWTYDLETRTAAYVIPSRIKRNEGVEAGSGHDLAPHFLPDDRIVFSSTRQTTSQGRQLNEGRIQLFAALTESGGSPSAVLHLYDPQLRSEEFKQISFNLSHDLDPTVLSSGEILFSRWNNTAGNHVSLYRLDPAGFELTPVFGFNSEEAGGVYTQPRELDDGRLVSVLRQPESETLGGDIVVIDAANYSDVDMPIPASAGLAATGQESLTSNDVRIDGLLSRGGQYGSVYALRDGTGRLLVTWSGCRVIDEEDATRTVPCSLQPENEQSAPPLYGAWVYSPSDDTQRPVVLAEAGFVISEIAAVEPRDFPDLVPLPESYNPELAQQGQGQLLIRSVYDIDGVDASPEGIALHATPGTPAYASRPARFLRIVQPVPIPDDEVFEIPGFAAGVAGGRNFREILGYVPVEPDGSVTVTLPAERPLTFDIVNERGRRIGARHNYWLQLGPGEVLACNGCHDAGSRVGHGRPDAEPAAANAGARTLAGGSLGFNGAVEALFAEVPGQSMAEVWNQHNPADNIATVDRSLSIAPTYTDEWAGEGVTPSPEITDRDYSPDWLDIPPERAIVVNSFDPGQAPRIVINYIDHIQPIWERVREARAGPDAVLVDTCIGCHSDEGSTRVPAGQLDLTAAASDIDPDHLRSYRELLTGDNEQWLNEGGTPVDRQRLCTVLDEEGSAIETIETIGLSSPARGGSANASGRFFACFEGGACGPPAAPALPENCVEEGEPIPASANTVNHVGWLSEPELHLISEWLDLGGQYFNNPFDDRLIE